jgi:hypothetical protein
MKEAVDGLSSTLKAGRAKIILTSLLISLSLFVLTVLFWLHRIRGYYFPAGDEFALLVHSARFFDPSIKDWFLRGFAEYFHPHPDISLPYSNFVRPGVNFTYYLNSWIFGRNWGAYLLSNYAIAAGIVGAVYYICRGLIGMPVTLCVGASLAAATSPALVWQMVYTPSFAFDYLAAFWILVHIIFLIHRRYLMAWVFLCFAIFTKELSFYAPLAACVVVYSRDRDKSVLNRFLLAGSYLLPLAGLMVLRRIDFRGMTGVYVLSGFSARSIVKGGLQGMMHWPYKVPWAQRAFEISAKNLFSVLFIVSCWAVVVAVTLYFIYPLLWGRTSDSDERENGLLFARETVSVFFVCSLIMPVGLNLVPRFGASVFPLLFICLAILIEKGGLSLPLRYGVAALFGIILCMNLWQMARTLSPEIAQKEQAKWALSRGLIEHLSRDTKPVNFLVGDYAEDFSSPEWVKRFSGYTGELVPVSNVDLSGCPVAPDVEVERMGARNLRFRSRLDANCGSNALFGAYREDLLSGMTLERHLAEADIRYTAADRPASKEEFLSQDLTIELYPRSPQFSVIVPDPGSPSRIRVLTGDPLP